jgi:hypothetical protein
MAQLTYTAQNGEEVSIPLSPEAGFTATILWFAPPSKGVEKKLKADLDKLGVPQLAWAGDHIVYSLPGQQLVVVIQLRETEGDARLAQAQMLIHRSRLEWIVVADGTPRLCVNEQLIPLMKIVKESMEIQLGGLDLTFREVDRLKVDREMLQNIQHRPCPYCGDRFQRGEEIIACPSCGTVQHSECWDEYDGRCSGPPGCRYGVKADRGFEIEGSEG